MEKASTLVSRITFIAVLVLMTVLATSLTFGQATYTWTGAIDTNWQSSGNWSPTRTSPNIADTLVFDGAQTNQPSDTINVTVARMLFTGFVQINMANRGSGAGNAGGVSIKCTGGSPDAFHINAGVTVIFSSTLLTSTTAAIDSIVMTSGGTGGNVYGTLKMVGRLQLKSDNTSSRLYFQSGSVCVDSMITGAIFGVAATAYANGVEFLAGSQFWIYRSSNPFQQAAPASLVIFNHGSLFRALSSNTPVFSGRTYGNFEFRRVTDAFAPFNVISPAISALDANVDTLRVPLATDTLNFATNTGTLFVKGNIEAVGVIRWAAGTKPVVFAGGIEQKIYASSPNAGNLSFTNGDSVRAGSTVHLINTIKIPTGKFSDVAGILNPDTATLAGAGTLRVDSGGVAQVLSATYAGNYTQTSTTLTQAQLLNTTERARRMYQAPYHMQILKSTAALPQASLEQRPWADNLC